MRRSGGFSLVELVVVLAVILLLAALSLPVVSKISVKMKQSQCLSNLHQLGIATALFMPDNRNVYPQMNYWPRDLVTYLNLPYTLIMGGMQVNAPLSSNPFWCPGAAGHQSTLSSYYKYQLAYGINGDNCAGLTAAQTAAAYPTSQISRLMLYADCTTVNLHFGNPERVPTNWHPPSIGVMFADFHVEKVNMSPTSEEWRKLSLGIP